MNDNEIEFPEESRIDREAAEWVAKRVRGFTPKEQDAFFDWFASDPRNSEFYGEHIKTWKRLDQLAQWRPEHSERPNQDLLKYHMSRGQWAWISGIAAAFVLLGSLWFALDLNPSNRLEYFSGNLVANGYESHVLPDGSIVEMNRGAALKVDYTPEMRRVELVSSEAHFDVAKNPDRPFIVHARGIDFRAVGTAFNVRLNEDSVELLVTEGHVQLIAPDPIADQGSPELSHYTRDVIAGQRTVTSLVKHVPISEVVEVSTVEVGELLAWKPKMLEFNEVPLSEVVEAFNLLNTVQLEIVDSELAKEPIVASFHTANVDHFVELLEWTLDVRSEQISDERVVLRRP